ncbi:uncharacterized protein LOC108909904 [Anoplophora glabripennis]|uniref:uncharacterized protein LOC108909904 n=1 Tax=Anoplophora glabripennis TaxID=217634 RepID=UPI0008744E7A|nr:uncharacterized protein LOC108909904 [Anoplophora glabripennis]
MIPIYRNLLLFLVVISYEETLANDYNAHIYTPLLYNRMRRDASGHTSCCTIPQCEDIQIGVEGHTAIKCYSKRVCGNICRLNDYQKVALPYSPYTYEYGIRNQYVKTVCKSNKCSTHRFDCSICPNPRETSLLALGVNSDCLNCYY